MAFLGGVVVELLVTEPTARPGRATSDVNVVIDIAPLRQYAETLREELIGLGLEEDAREGAPPDVRAFVAAAWRDCLGTDHVPALLAAHLAPDETSQSRAGVVLSRTEAMARLG